MTELKKVCVIHAFKVAAKNTCKYSPSEKAVAMIHFKYCKFVFNNVSCIAVTVC